MTRCLQLAQLGEGYTAPNPMVGALLLHNDTIIGEGYHRQYGGPHAEVNCINSVAAEHKQLVSLSRMYVSLEPCVHYGKTPPCADLIIREQIPEVVIACRDSFAKVNGQGIEKLKAAGIKVTEGILQNEAWELNKRFFTFHKQMRPYIILKWAQTNDGFIAKPGYETLKISNDLTNRFTHHLRATEAAIIIGTNTALHDNPSLTSRHWPGKSPLRIVIDKQLTVPPSAHIFNEDAPTVIINYLKDEIRGNIYFHKINPAEPLLSQLMELLYEKNITSLLVEGGSVLLNSFFQQDLWDECIVISNTGLKVSEGVAAPNIPAKKIIEQFSILSDRLTIYKNK